MKIYKPTSDMRVVVNEDETVDTYFISKLESGLSDTREWLTSHEMITDDMLLQWAKENYERSNDYREYQENLKEKEKLEKLLELVK